MFPEVRAEDRETWAFEERVLLQGLQDLVERDELLGDRQRSRPARRLQHPLVTKLGERSFSPTRIYGQPRRDAVQEGAASGDGQAAPGCKIVKEARPVAGKESHVKLGR